MVDSADQTLYPNELKPLCEKLRIITTILEDVCSSAMEAKRQIESLIKLGGCNVFSESRIVYRTWTCEKWLEVFANICDRYVNEYKFKCRTMENIAHSRSTEEIVVHSAVWEFQTFVNGELEQLFRFIVIEGNIEIESK